MPSATSSCRLCLQDVPFPAKWLLYPSCGHAFCKACTQGLTDACPTCHASTLGRPLVRILGVQVNDAQLAEKHRLPKDLEELQARWERKIQAMQMEVTDARDTVQNLQMAIMFWESRKVQEAGKVSATQDGGIPPQQGCATVAVQRGLINWDEARRLWESLKDEVIVLTPTLQDLQRPFLYFSLFVLYAMAVFLCVVMYALLDFRCTSSCPSSWSIPGK